MLRLASDADVHGEIVRGLRRRLPALDLIRVQDALPHGTPDPEVIPHDIEWEYREDPDEATDDQVELAASKIGGACYFSHALDPSERLLLFLDEDPANFNFGGDELMLAINESGAIRVAAA